MPQTKIAQIADSLAAGSAVGYGVHMLTNLDLIISILAGILVAASAGLSFYMNWERRKQQKKEQAESDSE